MTVLSKAPVLPKAPQNVDAISIGFGPAAIALACVLEDARDEGNAPSIPDIRFLERAAVTSWHPELLLSGTDINHSPFRDLVTPRNPRSRFSFAMYLKEKGRMFEFGLLGRAASRHEWSDYVAWVAAQVQQGVSYNETIREVLPGTVDGQLDHVLVETAAGRYATRNLIVSSGSSPNIPEIFVPHLGARVFHTSEFLTRLNAFGATPPRRWMVVGSGQSASESVLDIIDRQDEVHVLSVHRSIGFRLTQLGQFPNEVFSPTHVDYFHALGDEQRRQYLANSRSANYAGIDPDESQKLFSLIYEDRLAGRERLCVKGYHAVKALEPVGDCYRVTLCDIFTGAVTVQEVDAIVLGTGYLQHLVPPLLSNLQPWLVADDDGGLRIDRDYRIALKPGSSVRIFANGLSERSHGISDGQSFSLMALRAERISQALVA
jgi:L-ornithine N5-oxygenase